MLWLKASVTSCFGQWLLQLNCLEKLYIIFRFLFKEKSQGSCQYVIRCTLLSLTWARQTLDLKRLRCHRQCSILRSSPVCVAPNNLQRYCTFKQEIANH